MSSPPRYRGAGEDCSSRSKTPWSDTESPTTGSKGTVHLGTKRPKMALKTHFDAKACRSYRDAVRDCERHHGGLSETQEATYTVFILHVKKHFGQLDTDLKHRKK